MTLEEIKDNYANEQGRDTWDEFFSWNELCHTGIDKMQYHHDQIAQRYAQYQTQELTAWKESASKVFKNLDLQAIGKTLGIGLGEDVSVNVLPKVKELQEQNAELVEMLEDMETAWQSLPYGHNSVRDTQNWISNSIHPQILRMREWVSKHKTKYNHLKSNTNETYKI